MTAAALALPSGETAYQNHELHLAVEVIQGLIGLHVAYLVFGRYSQGGLISQLLLAIGLMTFGFTNLFLAGLTVAHQGSEDLLVVWARLVLSAAGAILLWLAALTRARVGSGMRSFLVVAAGTLVGMLALTGALIPLRDALPDVIEGSVARGELTVLDQHPLVIALHAMLTVLFGLASFGFTRAAARTADDLLGWIGAGAALGAFASFHPILPSTFTDYMYAGDLLTLGFFLMLLVGASREIGANSKRLHSTVAEIRQLTLLDELTGLRNRRGFAAAAGPVLKLAARGKSTVTVLFVDLDNLEGINESFGRAEGDRALQATAAILTDAVRDSDVAARLGVNEFCILLSPGSKPDVVLDRIKELLADQEEGSREPWMLSLGIGSATFDPELDTAIQEMIEKADEALGPLDAESVS